MRCAASPHVAGVTEPRLSPDGRIAIADIQYAVPAPGILTDAYAALSATAERAAAAGVQLELGGELPGLAEQPQPQGQEVIGLIAAVIVLLLVIRSVTAMGLPLGATAIGLATSIGAITLIAATADITEIATSLAAMIGLGVGIDYALFIVTRHRQHLAEGRSVEESAGRAIAAAGSAVLSAGLTVVVALSGLAIIGIPAVTRIGLTVGGTVLVMVAISLTLLPALLGFIGHRIDAFGVPRLHLRRARPRDSAAGETGWHRHGRRVAGRPWPWLLGGLAVLVLLALPVFSLRMSMPSAGTSPPSTSLRQAYDLTTAGFGAGANGPLLVAVEIDADADAALDPLRRAIGADPGIAGLSPTAISPDGTAAVIVATPTTAPQSEATTALVDRLRHAVIPAALAGSGAHAHVGGQTAAYADLNDRIATRLPWFVGGVVGLSVLLLMAGFRSVLVPLKAAGMNLLSIGAAYGVIVAVFQWGWLKDLFGVEQTVPIVSFVPMMMFAILFGLSMDYEVFLLSRIREHYARTGSNDRAVIEGIAGTARVITSAALIMISVFIAFGLGEDTTIKMVGLGLATAIFVDATIVRMVLVPATMQLLGDRNWWLPAWLDRLLPRLDFDGGSDQAVVELPAYAPERDDRALAGI